jgi:hypothetical protein
MKKTRVAVSSQISVFDFKKLLDKMEAIFDMCYHDKTFQGLKKQDSYTL